MKEIHEHPGLCNDAHFPKRSNPQRTTNYESREMLLLKGNFYYLPILGSCIGKKPMFKGRGGTFFKTEMGGLLKCIAISLSQRAAEHLSCNQRLKFWKICLYISARFSASYARLLLLSHFIFKKRASAALRIHLCKILTGQY